MTPVLLPAILLASMLPLPEAAATQAAATQAAGPQAAGPLTVSPMFGDHMVLPRDVPVPIWGTAAAAAAVGVTFGDVRARATADDGGAWRVELPPLPASAAPRVLVVQSGDLLVRCVDVVVGDVWLCAGQSNMAFGLSRSAGAAEALAGAERSDLRLAQHSPRVSLGAGPFAPDTLRTLTPETLFAFDGWARSDDTSAGPFSAVAWHFGARVMGALDVPIGLVHISVGGSPMEAWIPRTALAADTALAPLLENWLDSASYPAWCQGRARQNLAPWLEDPRGEAPRHPFEPGILYDAAVAPRAAFPFRGVLWYQGESNATVDGGLGPPVEAETNARKLRALVTSWRAAFGQPQLPFVMAQLPGLDREWAPFRDVQARVAAQDEHVQLAVTIDVGHPTDVHPKRKAPVGERMARLALASVYGLDIAASGPTYAGLTVGEDGVIVVTFEHAAEFTTTDGETPRCFAIAAVDGRYHPAEARIDGPTVVLRSTAVPHAVDVRYAWGNDPRVNLINAEGLPAAPFRTDTGPMRRKIRVACIGDSITGGTGLADPGLASYPARLRELLGPDYAVRNFGRPGAGAVRRSMRGAQKRAYAFGSQHAAALSWAPDVVVSNLGINDVMDWERFGRSDFVADYRSLLADYRGLSSEPRILLWTPLAPLFDGHRYHGDPHLGEIDAAIAEVARIDGLETLDLRAPLFEHAGWFLADKIHPDEAGAKAIAAAVAAALR